MNREYKAWEDVDLSGVDLDLAANRVTLLLSSGFDGSDIVKIFCTGIMHIRINHAAPDESSIFPVFVGKAKLTIHKADTAGKVLDSVGYGFRFENGQVLPEDFSQFYLVEIEGGEIDIQVIAENCKTSEGENNPQSLARD